MTTLGPDEVAFALAALVVLSAMCMIYPLALRHADRHAGDAGVFGEIFRGICRVLKFANVVGWSLLIATMVTDLTLPIDPWVIAISISLISFSLMDMETFLAKTQPD